MIGRRRRSSRGGWSPKSRNLAIGAGTLVMLWLSIAVSAAGVFREFAPEVALRFWPVDGFAKSSQAERLLATGLNRPNIARARRLSLESMDAEPAGARAARMLALLTPADRQTARRRFLYARQLSRRDLPTTLWLIEDQVRRNDVAGALHEYDIALRTSRAAPPILFPILNSALADTRLRVPIGDLLATGKPWVPEFVEYALSNGEQTGPLALAMAARPRALNALPLELKRRLVAALIDHHQFDLATRLYDALAHQSYNPAEPVRAGNFVGVGEWPPLDWSINPAGDYGASILGDDGLLSVYARSGASGTVARQLILLRPGSYELLVRSTVSAEAGAGFASISLICADDAHPPIVSVQIRSGSAAAMARRFAAPRGPCRYYWVNVEANSEGESAQFEASIDDIAIRPVPQA